MRRHMASRLHPSAFPAKLASSQRASLGVTTICAMSISPALRASARAAYRDVLRASAVTFAGDVPVKTGMLVLF